MADGLQGVLDDLKAVIIAAAAPTAVTVEIGDDKVGEHGAPPRVVLYPTEERALRGQAPAALRQRSNPAVSKLTRRCSVVVWMWGAFDPSSPYEGTDGLANTVLAALNTYSKTNVGTDEIDGRWAQSDEGVLGKVLVWRVEVLVPVSNPTHATAPVEQFDNDYGTRRPDGTEESGGTVLS